VLHSLHCSRKWDWASSRRSRTSFISEPAGRTAGANRSFISVGEAVPSGHKLSPVTVKQLKQSVWLMIVWFRRKNKCNPEMAPWSQAGTAMSVSLRLYIVTEVIWDEQQCSTNPLVTAHSHLYNPTHTCFYSAYYLKFTSTHLWHLHLTCDNVLNG
jgi:hypothetical protein